MGAIYNIYFECETRWKKPSYCTKQQSIYPSLWQLSPLLQCTHLESSQETGWCSSACRKKSCPGLDLAPPSIPAASFALWFRVCWLPFPPCTWAYFRLLFHEIFSQENLPVLVWQGWRSLPFQSWKKTLGISIGFNPLRVETGIPSSRECRDLAPIPT